MTQANHLCIVGRSTDIAAAAGPVDVDVFAFWVLFAGKLWLDEEGVGAEVVTLSLEEVGRQVLSAEAVVEGQSGAEGWHGNTPLSTLGDDVTPSWLCLVNGLVEEVVEQEVLEVWVGTVCVCDVLKEDGSDDAASTPHEGDLWLAELPVVLLGSLQNVSNVPRIGISGQHTACISMKPCAYEIILDA